MQVKIGYTPYLLDWNIDKPFPRHLPIANDKWLKTHVSSRQFRHKPPGWAVRKRHAVDLCIRVARRICARSNPRDRTVGRTATPVFGKCFAQEVNKDPDLSRRISPVCGQRIERLFRPRGCHDRRDETLDQGPPWLLRLDHLADPAGKVCRCR